MTSVRRALSLSIAAKRSAKDFRHGPTEKIARRIPIAFGPNQAALLDGVAGSSRVLWLVNECNLPDALIDPVNSPHIIDKKLGCQWIADIRVKLNHFHVSPRPPAHIAKRDGASSPHSCFLCGPRCHDPVTPLQLSRLFLLTSQPITTCSADESPRWWVPHRLEDGGGAGFRRTPVAWARLTTSLAYVAAAVTHSRVQERQDTSRAFPGSGWWDSTRPAVTHPNPVRLPPSSKQGRNLAGGARTWKSVPPPAFSSFHRDRSPRPLAVGAARRANQGDAAIRFLETRFRRCSP